MNRNIRTNCIYQIMIKRLPAPLPPPPPRSSKEKELLELSETLIAKWKKCVEDLKELHG